MDRPEKAWDLIMNEFDVKEVFFNEDYEPYATKRDKDITEESQSLSARLQLLNYKAEIRYKDWFHDLKQQSNIEILTDN